MWDDLYQLCLFYVEAPRTAIFLNIIAAIVVVNSCCFKGLKGLHPQLLKGIFLMHWPLFVALLVKILMCFIYSAVVLALSKTLNKLQMILSASAPPVLCGCDDIFPQSTQTSQQSY